MTPKYDNPFGRADDEGWTLISPDTLPSDDMYNIFVANRYDMLYVSRRKGWSDICQIWRGNNISWTHWRVVPDHWLPLPTNGD